MIAVLGVISTFCGLVIVTADILTKPRIERNQAIITNMAIVEMIPAAERIDIFEVDPSGEIRKLDGMKGSLPKIFPCYDASGQLIAIACEAAGGGYAGVIKTLYAYSPEKQAITGFKVIESKETPGLGDKIKSDAGFLANFEELDVKLDGQKTGLANSIKAVKHGTKSNPWEIDAISGATVSSTAVGRLLNASAQQRIPLIDKCLEQLKEGK